MVGRLKREAGDRLKWLIPYRVGALGRSPGRRPERPTPPACGCACPSHTPSARRAQRRATAAAFGAETDGQNIGRVLMLKPGKKSQGEKNNNF